MSVAAKSPIVTIGGIASNQLKCISLQFPVGHAPARAIVNYLPGAPGGTVANENSALPFDITALNDVPLGDGSVQVTISDDGQRFIGYVVDVQIDTSRGIIQITAEDARSFFAKMPIHGRVGKNVEGNAATAPAGRWNLAAMTTYNEAGLADMLTAGGDGTQSAHRMFIQPEHMINELGVENTDGATLWTPFDILTYIRQVFNKNFSATLGGTPANDLGDWNTWITWAVIDDNNLKKDPTSGSKLSLNDFAITGLGMGEAITETLNRVSRYSWFLDHSSNPPILTIRDADTDNVLVINAIEPGDSIGDTVAGEAFARVIRLAKSNRNVYDQCFAMGAKKLFECSFMTREDGSFEGDISKTLIQGWDPDLERDWIDHHLDPDAGDAKERRLQYVFRRWLIRADVNWFDYFENDRWYIASRPVSALLASRDVEKSITFLADPEFTLGIPIRRKFLLERYAKNDDDDFVWQKMPENISIIPLQDVGGFTLPDSLRDTQYKPQGTETLTSLAWSWQADSNDDDHEKAFDMRLTITIEADERLSVSRGTAGAGPKRRLLVNAGSSYQQQRRSNAVVPLETDASDAPSEVPGISGGPRDDTETIIALAQRRLDKASWSGVTGTVTLTQVDYFWHDKVGLLVSDLGANALPGDKPMLSMVTYDYEAQSTELTLER